MTFDTPVYRMTHPNGAVLDGKKTGRPTQTEYFLPALIVLSFLTRLFFFMRRLPYLVIFHLKYFKECMKKKLKNPRSGLCTI